MYTGWQGFVFGNSGLPFALCFRCLIFALRVVLLLCGLFPSLGARISLADVCEHLVVFCGQYALHQLKPGNTADNQTQEQQKMVYIQENGTIMWTCGTVSSSALTSIPKRSEFNRSQLCSFQQTAGAIIKQSTPLFMIHYDQYANLLILLLDSALISCVYNKIVLVN